MSLLQIAILALIQGAAELLPVSSSAHVIVAEHLMGLEPSSPELTFLLVMLHTGTMGAVVVYFWPRWKRFLAPARHPAEPAGTAQPGTHMLKMILLATACTGVIGLGLKFVIERVVLVHLLGHDRGEVEDLFDRLPLIAGSLVAVGLLIIASGSWPARAEAARLSAPSAALIGIVQGLCLPFRGFSRSGATISVALLRGVSRPLAEDFSFALAVLLTPPVIARELYRLLRHRGWQGSADLVPMLAPGLAGMALSCLAGLAALVLLSAVLERGRWKYFGYYCLMAAAGVWALARLKN
jgi:undecaprenyl-diphosphatase